MKNILAKLLDVVLCIVIITLCGCLALKPISVNLIKDLLSQGDVQSEMTSVIQIVYPNATDDKVSQVENKILENKDVDNTLYSYLNYYTNIASGNDISESEVNEAATNLIDNNFDDIQNDLGLNLTEDQKKTIKDMISSGNDEVVKKLKESAESTSDKLSPFEKNVLKACSVITSKSILKILGVTIAVLAILIILLRLRRNKWIQDLSVTSIMAGIITGLLLPLLMKIVGNLGLGELTGKSVNVNVNTFFVEGIVLFGIGMVLMIVYKIVGRNDRNLGI